ncbi:MAG TPA: hypothetical protein VLH81_04080, partial [Desulfobacterales bacterium]|nr:hypothetical protein [Desulfobacterales bacterium]
MSVTGVAASDQDGFAADSEHVRHEGGGIGDLLGGLLGGGGLGSALEAGVGAGVGRQVGGGMGSVPGGGLGEMLPALLPVVLGMLGGKAGGTDRPGVHQLVNTVHEKGLGDVAASWVGTGAFSRKASYGGQPRGLGYRSALDHEGDPVALSFVALDFETANAFRGSPCAVGLARVLDGEVVETARWLMRP